MTCTDSRCKAHGHIALRGRTFTGTVKSAKMQKTVTVAWQRKVALPKFERHMTKTSTVKAHNPECIDAKEGDLVKIQECRPLSKMKHFIVTEKLGKGMEIHTRNEDIDETNKSE